MHLTGLEPALLSEMEPKSIVYANFTTGANVMGSRGVEPLGVFSMSRSALISKL